MKPDRRDRAAEAEIRTLILARADAMRRRDARALVGDLSASAIVFEMIPPLRLPAGAASDLASVQAWLNSWQGDLEVEIRDLDIRVSGDVAFASSLNRLSGTAVNGRLVDMWMRSTLGFEKTADGWLIVHAHTSVPFHPDASLRAAVDLKPD